jgi:uncharacterized protein (TIGR01777 family)
VKVIVAGGSGLIGHALIRSLVAAGDEVVVLSRRGEGPPGARAVQWNARSVAEPWASELAGAAAVVNLSGASVGGRWTRKRKEAIRSSRVDSTKAIVEAIGDLEPGWRPAVLVNASGIGYAGETGEAIVSDDAPPGKDFLARVGVEWEGAAAAAEQHGVRVVRLRTALVFARDAEAFRLLALPFRLFAGGKLGDGRQWFPWVHIDDVVGAYRLALDDDRLSGPVNLVAPGLVREREVAHELGRILHRPSFFPAPAFALRAVLGEQADLLLHGQRAYSAKLGAMGFRYPELRPALEQALGTD